MQHITELITLINSALDLMITIAGVSARIRANHTASGPGNVAQHDGSPADAKELCTERGMSRE
jgi:hypothetical protein